MVWLHVSPNPALVDVSLNIQIRGLRPGTEMTLLSRVHHRNDRYYAYGYYKANSMGTVELTRMPSYGGTYTGIF